MASSLMSLIRSESSAFSRPFRMMTECLSAASPNAESGEAMEAPVEERATSPTGSDVDDTQAQSGRVLPLKKRRFEFLSNPDADSQYADPDEDEEEEQGAAAAPHPSSSVCQERSHEESPLTGAARKESMGEQKGYHQDEPDQKKLKAHPATNGSSPSGPPHNGCHGRTTRTDSYCRRAPCYNGSNYCKLHYQQYVVLRTRSDLPSASSAPRGDSSAASSASVTSEASAQAVGRPKKPSKYQNKCFNTTSKPAALDGGGLRCQATTSRGHACAYVAVVDTKYCFLHADYDTNPPRRRRPRQDALKKLQAPAPPLAPIPQLIRQESHEDSFSSSRLVARANLLTGMYEVPLAALLPLNASYLNARLHDPFAPPVSSRPSLHALLANTSTPTRPAPLTRQDSLANLTYLSQLAKNQWHGKQVMILSGPFQYQSGRVEKWGNGWVTVRMENKNGSLDEIMSRLQEDSQQGLSFKIDNATQSVFHNRRAFELALLGGDSEFVSSWRKAAPQA